MALSTFIYIPSRQLAKFITWIELSKMSSNPTVIFRKQDCLHRCGINISIDSSRKERSLEIGVTSSNGYKTVGLNEDKLQNTSRSSDHVTVRLPTSYNTNLVYVKRDADDDVTRRDVALQMTSDDSTQLPVQYFVLDQAQVDRERPVDF